ncbi:MAG: YggS family pyridoxal phosphate-dependent enzyme [Cyanobacteria bacterium P01_D01_bin.36]
MANSEASFSQESAADLSANLSANLSGRLSKIRALIPPPVRLIAVSKTFPGSIVRAAYAEGIRDFAENKVQEALSKQADLSDLTDVTWHFIGHIQSNKSRKVVENFNWIHSVDSLKLANRLDRQAAELNRCPNCCLQVKLLVDPNKDGFDVDELMAALPALDQLEHLNICGLMVILPYGLSPSASAAGFAKAQDLAKRINQSGMIRAKMTELSMGMSGDFEAAIAAGATMVRIGSGLFGSR